jgi:aerobic C4-dicarboxylate transport protein
MRQDSHEPVGLESKPRASRFGHLYLQVLLAIVAGAFIGDRFPQFGIALKPLGDAFIKLIRMLVAPIIFTTVTLGIAEMRNLKQVGRVGFKAFVYFEIVTTFSLVIGWLVVKWIEPGAGVNANIATLNRAQIQQYVTAGKVHGLVDFVLNVIPSSIIGAFAQGDIVQVLFISVIFGLALSSLGQANRSVVDVLETLSSALMKIMGVLVRLAPLAALGAIAAAIGEHGIKILWALGKLMACVYITCFLFVVLILGSLLRMSGLSLWKFLKQIREEIFIVLGTASSESVFPRMMAKMEAVGCSQPIVRLVLPAGYSFNLDGSSIYLTMGAIFVAQALNIDLTLRQEFTLLAVCLITSKGAAGVVGSAFVALAATLSSMHMIPVEGMVLILGVDRILSEARAVTNLIGNGVATLLLAKWENKFEPNDRFPVALASSRALKPELNRVD